MSRDIWERLWPRFYSYLPASFVSFCAMRVMVEATTGKYGNTVMFELTAMEAINRFSRIHALGGSGKDEHYDSNRNRP